MKQTLRPALSIPDYNKYGFAYTNAHALPEVSYIELIVAVNEKGMPSSEAVIAELRQTLGGANVISRHHQPSSRYITEDLAGIKQIGLLFPIAFFLTAALVTWITLSRMMDNQRQHLGTLRSIGYSKKTITSRFTLGLPLGILGGYLLLYVMRAVNNSGYGNIAGHFNFQHFVRVYADFAVYVFRQCDDEQKVQTHQYGSFAEKR